MHRPLLHSSDASSILTLSSLFYRETERPPARSVRFEFSLREPGRLMKYAFTRNPGAMSTKFFLLRTLFKAFAFPSCEASVQRTYSADSPLPQPVLDTIQSVTDAKGWLWKGACSRLPQVNEGIREVLMHTPHGGLHVLHIKENGKLIYVGPREEPYFLYQAVPEYMHL